MCGITGIINIDPSRTPPVQQSDLAAMTAALTHRGPDDRGIYISPNQSAGLGHRRLSIIDIETGRQPLSNEDGTVWIVFNGECYNFNNLREDLISRGHQFKTHSDTEAIVHLYEEYGSDCVKHIRGMFALAIWDQTRQTIFLARDRMGQKPLYYSICQGRLYFASECKALLKNEQIPRAINHTAIARYLLLGYNNAPDTAFENILQLPPAHHLTLDQSSWRIASPVCYWTIPSPSAAAPSRNSMKAAVESVTHELYQAVQLRLVSEVPLGAFLSGGIDSSAITALMTRITRQPVEACAIGFDHDLYNELKWAQMAADHLGAHLHHQTVTPQLNDTIEALSYQFDDPFADSSALPTWHLSQMTRQHVTVALTGDGGDELFGGYNRYRAAARARLLQTNILIHWIAGLRFWRRLKTPEHHSFLRQIKRFCTALNLPPHQQYLQWIAIFDPAMIKKLLLDSPDLSDLTPTAGFVDCPSTETYLNQIFYFDSTNYLPGDLNTKIDRASMAFGLELRSPFQDHKLIETVNRLPFSLRFNGSTSKPLLKNAMKNLLPPAIIKRPKMGFGVPVGQWFRGPLKSLLHDTILSPQAQSRQLLDRPFLDNLIQQHQSGSEDHGQQLWSLVMLELWLRNYMKS